jgi:hypothetical protein
MPPASASTPNCEAALDLTDHICETEHPVVGDIAGAQAELCNRFGVDPFPAPNDLKVGVNHEISGDARPIHGLRHPPEGDTTGWYIWTGDYSETDDFFEPLHVAHLRQSRPEVMPYLALPPGWRFLIADDHEDVWYDEALLAL